MLSPQKSSGISRNAINKEVEIFRFEPPKTVARQFFMQRAVSRLRITAKLISENTISLI